jgi:peptide/nickel transport system permease protein
MWRYGFLLGLIIGITVVLPLLLSTDPMQTNPESAMQPPNSLHLLGTDHLGRDVLSRVLYGGHRTLVMAFLATGLAAVPGTLLGLLAGYSSSWADRLIGLYVNAVLAIPGLLLAMIVLTLLGQGLWPLTLATGVAQVAPFILVVRGAVITIRTTGYVQAAEALGATRWRIILSHILPNIRPTLFAYLGVTFAYTIINGSGLSFLGLGGELGVPDWGVMLAEGRGFFRTAPWISIAPGAAITIIVMTVNSLADHMTKIEARGN